MKSTKKYLGTLLITIFLASTLTSCWVVVPSSTKVNHVHKKRDNGLHKGWYKHPKHKKHKKHKHGHRHGHADFAPIDDFSDNSTINQSELFRVDQPE
ncbi:MAG: hypothetical protein HWE22_19920 [Flavobacteriales bacterium]|nr:hypothetical protein [Flavobacteriales bacterium]